MGFLCLAVVGLVVVVVLYAVGFGVAFSGHEILGIGLMLLAALLAAALVIGGISAWAVETFGAAPPA